MRVILDTNVLLSALLSEHGAPAGLLAAWKRKLFALVISDALKRHGATRTVTPAFMVNYLK